MRRTVPARIAEALKRARPTLEEYISRHLEYPLSFPDKFARCRVDPRIPEPQGHPLAKALAAEGN